MKWLKALQSITLSPRGQSISTMTILELNNLHDGGYKTGSQVYTQSVYMVTGRLSTSGECVFETSD